jgi:membrane protein implicated in regulation of membrane protease activity
MLTILIAKLAILWLALTIVAFAVHIFTRDYISLSAGIGAGVTFAAFLMGYNSLLTQALVFAITTLVFAVSFIPAMIQKSDEKRMKEQVPTFELRGRTAQVTQAIDNMQAQGTVTLDGQTYTARASDGNLKPAGTTVTILDRDHHILIVR